MPARLCAERDGNRSVPNPWLTAVRAILARTYKKAMPSGLQESILESVWGTYLRLYMRQSGPGKRGAAHDPVDILPDKLATGAICGTAQPEQAPNAQCTMPRCPTLNAPVHTAAEPQQTTWRPQSLSRSTHQKGRLEYDVRPFLPQVCTVAGQAILAQVTSDDRFGWEATSGTDVVRITQCKARARARAALLIHKSRSSGLVGVAVLTLSPSWRRITH